MEQENLRPTEDELMAREEKCRKSRKVVTKAIFMRLVVTVLLIWIMLGTSMEPWIIGLIALVLVINLGGALPLVAEWRKRTRELREIMDQYE